MENILGERIKLLRINAKLSQVDLAEKLNISNTTLSQYEKGVRIPNDNLKIMIATFFETSLDYLFGVTAIPDQYILSSYEPTLTSFERKVIDAFKELDADNQSIAYGEILKLKKEQESSSLCKKQTLLEKAN